MSKPGIVLIAVALFCAGAVLGRWYQEPVATAPPVAQRQPLYYRNPMGLADTSPVPKKDGMGMDYIPVYEGDQTDGKVLNISAEKVQKIGVRTEVVSSRELMTEVAAVGVIEADERSLVTISPRFEGWIETLHVNETGRSVRRGEPLFSAYSPELLATQQEYLLALDATRRSDGKLGEDLLQTARARLLNWQVAEEDLRALERRREPLRTLTFRSPADGVVLEKGAVAGMRFMPGEVLYRLADLRTVWLMASVYEQDLADIGIGQPVSLRVDSFPSETFTGRIGFVYPSLDEATRTAKLRVELANADLRLRPGMYGRVTVEIAGVGGAVPSVPDSALIDSGKRQLVLVELGEGRFGPREVVVGRRGMGYVEIRSGLVPGERVVVRANFLIDAESNLKAAMDSFGHDTHGTSPAQETEPEPVDAQHGEH